MFSNMCKEKDLVWYFTFDENYIEKEESDDNGLAKEKVKGKQTEKKTYDEKHAVNEFKG